MMNRWNGFAQSMNLNREGLTSAISFIKNVALLNVVGDQNEVGLSSVTPNIYLMGFPCAQPSGPSGVSIEAVSTFLRTNHAGTYMVWNLSEKTYDYSLFDEQVVEFRFPGYPAPPLDKIFSICRSMDAWLRADKANVAVVHCQTGRGRSVTALASYLCWNGQFASPFDALATISEARSVPEIHLIIPSQRRYLEYVSRIVAGQFPSTKPLKLDKIIMNSIPSIDGGKCRPYVQIFKYAKLIYTSASKAKDVVAYEKEDLSAMFTINKVIEGDILIRIRHFAADGSRVSIMRFSFHTGFIQSDIERFRKHEIDGACGDNRFDDDFLLDLAFSAAIDDDGNEIESSLGADYWSTMSRREEHTPREKTVPKRFSLFDEDEDEDMELKDLETETEAEAKAETETWSSQPEESAPVKNHDGDLDAYVQGLDNIDISDVNVDSDTDDLLAELQKEIQQETLGQDGSGPADENLDSELGGDLDDEINRLLAEADDHEEKDEKHE